jgi:hypothetical protein
MRKQAWYLVIAAGLLAVSAGLYLMHYSIFHNAHHIYIYLLGDIAFLPLEVLVVALVVDSLLAAREKRATLEKLNMVIGAFFSEVGTELIRRLTALDPMREEKRRVLAVTAESDDPGFKKMKHELSALPFEVNPTPADYEGLQSLLVAKRDFMVRLLENPLLLEHESFTDLLWAVFHLTEELDCRPGFTALPAPDLAHLAGDSARAYERVVSQWLDYMKHLKKNYPYLFSLALRLNPFNPEPSVLVI